MKKVLVVMAMIMGVGCMSAIAAEASVDSVACCQATQDEYAKIENQRSICGRKGWSKNL